jgi:ABC-type transporter Mla MlaB component
MAVSPPVDLPVRWELSRRPDGTGTLAFIGELDTESTPVAWRSLESELAGSRMVRLDVEARRLECDSADLALWDSDLREIMQEINSGYIEAGSTVH